MENLSLVLSGLHSWRRATGAELRCLDGPEVLSHIICNYCFFLQDQEQSTKDSTLFSSGWF